MLLPEGYVLIEQLLDVLVEGWSNDVPIEKDLVARSRVSSTERAIWSNLRCIFESDYFSAYLLDAIGEVHEIPPERWCGEVFDACDRWWLAKASKRRNAIRVSLETENEAISGIVLVRAIDIAEIEKSAPWRTAAAKFDVTLSTATEGTSNYRGGFTWVDLVFDERLKEELRRQRARSKPIRRYASECASDEATVGQESSERLVVELDKRPSGARSAAASERDINNWIKNCPLTNQKNAEKDAKLHFGQKGLSVPRVRFRELWNRVKQQRPGRPPNNRKSQIA